MVLVVVIYGEEGKRKQDRESGEDMQQRVAGWKSNLWPLQEGDVCVQVRIGAYSSKVVHKWKKISHMSYE